MTNIIIGFILGIIGHNSALILTAHFILEADKFEDFVRSLIRWVIPMTIVVIGSWVVFGGAAAYIIAFAIAHALTIAFIDLEGSYEDL